MNEGYRIIEDKGITGGHDITEGYRFLEFELWIKLLKVMRLLKVINYYNLKLYITKSYITEVYKLWDLEFMS